MVCTVSYVVGTTFYLNTGDCHLWSFRITEAFSGFSEDISLEQVLEFVVIGVVVGPGVPVDCISHL